MIAAIAFYLFAAVLLVSAGMVVSARNPVHSVLFLILAFFNAAALFLLAGAEFLAMILVIVYVGAVAVLFLFVVMMLDIDFAALRSRFQQFLPVGLAVGTVLLIELGIVLAGWKLAPDLAAVRFSPNAPDMHNTAQLGRLIYTDYVLLFQAAGLVLLVAMIGAIVLTLREKRNDSRRQSIAEQVARSPANSLQLVDVGIGEGVAPGDIRRKLVPVLAHAGHGHEDQHDDAHQEHAADHGHGEGH